MGAFANLRRLHHAARVLARHDALVPREYLAAMPLGARIARRLLGTREREDKALMERAFNDIATELAL